VRVAARLKTLSELLVDTLSSRQAADFIVKQWGRENRYAGSKDRRFLSDGLFAILRHYGSLHDRLGTDDPLLITMLAFVDVFEGDAKMTLEEVLAMADGQAHNPEALSDAQIKQLQDAAAKAPQSRAGKLNVAEWMLEELDAGLGEPVDAVLQAMGHRAPLDVRVNTLKADAEQAMAALQEQGFEVQAHGQIANALRVSLPATVTQSKAFEDGLIEVQDAGAQAVSQFAAAKPHETVLDYCAGAGGKSLAMAALMGNSGRLIVNDTDSRRMRPIEARAARAGVKMLETATPDLLDKLVGRCDLVMADVPCSGSGRWRRSPETKWRLTPDSMLALRSAQLNILKKAATYVAPGGRLVYVTCSVFAAENSKLINSFLAANPAFERHLQATDGDDIYSRFKSQGEVQLDPVRSDTDGLFCAVLRHRDTGQSAGKPT
jgi:16S rRNA (cytosine967-C5)-methyltransferase